MHSSPVLIGRADLLDLAGRRLAEAAGGAGAMLFLSGEAGIGKTRLRGDISHCWKNADRSRPVSCSIQAR